MTGVRDRIERASEVLSRRDGASLVHHQNIDDRNVFGSHLETDTRRIEVVEVHVSRAPPTGRHVDPALEDDGLTNDGAGRDIDIQLETAVLEPLSDCNSNPAGGRADPEVPVGVKP